MQNQALSNIQPERHPTVRHYDIDADFFKTFLDPYLKYTCGLFDAAHPDLESAATNMLDYLIRSARISNSSRVLEIGSGWGSMVRRLRETVGCEYVGMSPSGRQNAYIRSEIAPVQLIEGCFEELGCEALGRFDAIFLVGSFCHLSAKPEQLTRLRRLLRPGGKIVIEDSFFLSEDLYRKHAQRPETEFLQRQVFGYAEIPSLAGFSDMARAAGLRISTLKDTTDDYATTIAIWLDRLAAAPEGYRHLTDTFVKYLQIAQMGWNYTTSNYVAVLEALPVRNKH
jgi:cyclopropane-fatty-acyl-phospholipid synthase